MRGLTRVTHCPPHSERGASLPLLSSPHPLPHPLQPRGLQTFPPQRGKCPRILLSALEGRRDGYLGNWIFYIALKLKAPPPPRNISFYFLQHLNLLKSWLMLSLSFSLSLSLCRTLLKKSKCLRMLKDSEPFIS